MKHMNEQQLMSFAMDTTKNIAALWESTKSAHHRINETDRITAGIHDLAKSIAEMATEIRLLTKRMDSSVERIEQEQKAQGGRISNIEKVILAIKHNKEELAECERRIDAIEKEPASKWKTLVAQVTALMVTAAMGAIIAKFI